MKLGDAKLKDYLLGRAKTSLRFVFCVLDHEIWYKSIQVGLGVPCQVWRDCRLAMRALWWESSLC